MQIVSKIRLTHGAADGVFVRTEDDRVLLVSAETASQEDIRQMFREAHEQWNIPFLPVAGKKDFSGALIMLDSREDAAFRKLRQEFGFTWRGDLKVAEPVFIIGSNIAGIGDEEIRQLAPYWGKARIFTLRGFENYLRGNGAANRCDKELNSLLSRCDYMEEGYFRWPHTDSYPGRGFFDPNWKRANGVLSEMGYHVGRANGLPADARRLILDEAYHFAVPYIDAENMVEWNSPETPFRLRKMANSLASFARNAKRRRDADCLADAIADWENDLAYLKSQYYDGQYDYRDFRWPNTMG